MPASDSIRTVLLHEKELPLVDYLAEKLSLDEFVVFRPTPKSQLVYFLEPQLVDYVTKVIRHRKKLEALVFLKYIIDEIDMTSRRKAKVRWLLKDCPDIQEVLFSRAALDFIFSRSHGELVNRGIQNCIEQVRSFTWDMFIQKQPVFVAKLEEDLAGETIPMAYCLKAAVPEYLAKLLKQESQPGKVLFLLLFARPVLEDIYNKIKQGISYSGIAARLSSRKVYGMLSARYEASKLFIAVREILPGPEEIYITPAARKILLSISSKVPELYSYIHRCADLAVNVAPEP